MPRTLLVSTRNSAYQVLESLRANRQKRHRSRAFLVEGVLPITRALAHGWTFEAVAFTPHVRLSAWASDVIARANPPVQYALAPDLLRALSGKTESSELIAVVRMPDDDVRRIRVARNLLALVMDAPSNPGNLGTIVRSCDALGAQGVVVTGHAADPYDPGAVTASRGSLFAVPVVRLDSPGAVEQWIAGLRRALGRCVVVGADEAGDVELPAHDFAPPTVIVLGNEQRGLGRAYRAMCDARVRIPMCGTATSLNVSVAASIVLYEVARQRRWTGAEGPLA
jgi:23S rRNA (uridine2479-2'-O)-methyltransferase